MALKLENLFNINLLKDEDSDLIQTKKKRIK